ncbi:hypothetical protein EDD22DRAFT_853218 [Suillus occidentalis]|nr:hypothetical protein EDD22DRAFT_853218 [Suillus occidentalis]
MNSKHQYIWDDSNKSYLQSSSGEDLNSLHKEMKTLRKVNAALENTVMKLKWESKTLKTKYEVTKQVILLVYWQAHITSTTSQLYGQLLEWIDSALQATSGRGSSDPFISHLRLEHDVDKELPIYDLNNYEGMFYWTTSEWMKQYNNRCGDLTVKLPFHSGGAHYIINKNSFIASELVQQQAWDYLHALWRTLNSFSLLPYTWMSANSAKLSKQVAKHTRRDIGMESDIETLVIFKAFVMGSRCSNIVLLQMVLLLRIVKKSSPHENKISSGCVELELGGAGGGDGDAQSQCCDLGRALEGTHIILCHLVTVKVIQYSKGCRKRGVGAIIVSGSKVLMNVDVEGITKAEGASEMGEGIVTKGGKWGSRLE